MSRTAAAAAALARPHPGAAARAATRVAFFVLGFGMSAWAPLVPYAKLRLGVDDATLGVLLLCLGAGSLLTTPVTGLLAARFGCRRVIVTAGLCICFVLPMLATADSMLSLAPALLLFGASLGAMDVAVNVHAVIVEASSRRAVMSGFHALFSVGGISGAACVSALLAAGASPAAAVLCIGPVIAALLLWSARHLLPYGSEAKGGKAAPSFAWPRGVVLLVGVMCFACFLSEGAMLDWSGVFLTTLRGLDPARAGLGYAVFSVAMTIGRLSGDRVVHAVGPRPVMVAGALVAAAGLVLVVAVPFVPVAFAGLVLMGLGQSNVVPLLFSALGRQRVMPANLAVSTVSTLGGLGILAGPAAIGAVAYAASLPVAFLCIAALLALVAAGSRMVVPRQPV
jgi:predicted MFS family arabinose efflux permease